MKKNLRMLCLGLAAATFTCGFAQQDYTDKLKNTDMEQGLKGWVFDGTDVMGKNTKNVATHARVGFHGMSQGVQEAWHSDPNNPLGDSYVMQRVKELPAGTYVFGAYAAAAKQNNRLVKDGKEAGWSNRDSINGVVLFANDAKVRVAADNPDMAYRGEVYKFAHSSKFNVAVTVPGEGELAGYLNVGLRVNRTNANYVVWDNATLYYFGDMSEADALDAMAEIDMTNAAAIADTLVGYKMNVDTLENLQDAIAKVKKETSTAASLWDDSEDLFYNMGLARVSITEFENLKKHIESAIVVKNGSWSKDGMDWYYDDLVDAIEEAEEAYEEAEVNRTEMNELRAALSQMVGWMRVDSLYTAREALQTFINTPNIFTGGPGMYSVAQQNQLKALDKEVGDSLLATEDMGDEARPQDLYPYIARIYALIENVKNNPIPTEYSTMPVEFKPNADGDYKGWIEGAEWYSQADRIIAYNSPMYRFASKIETFRITVKKNKNGAAHFCLSGLTFYDGNGEVIPLTEENLSTAYDHNTLNPGAEDGGGIPALFDGDNHSYFHSAWQNSPAGEHYLDVVLPNGGYDAFSFQMLSRSNSNSWDQSHTFPGEMIIDTPKPERDAMKVILDQAKALNPYSGTDPGFYVSGEPALEELAAVIAEADALIAANAAESEMTAVKEKLNQAMFNFQSLLDENAGNLPVNVPEAGKVYRIVSGLPAFFEKQGVEKALTVHAADSTLWWENVCADSLHQEFMFEPITDEDGAPYIELVEDGTNENGESILVPYYCYHVKNVYHNLYVDSAFVGNQVKLVEEAADTVKLRSLGRGQWRIMLRGSQLHAGDHYSGNPSTSAGAYGGTYGISSGICAYGGGIDDASAWFIREMPALPFAVQVEAGEFKSDCIHFEATDSIILTADADCAFDGLKLYDLYGGAIEFDVEVNGAVAAIKTKSVVPACAFAFNNNEGVSTVSLDVFVPESEVEGEEPADLMAALEEKLEAAVAIAPEKGTGVGQYADIADYAAVIAAAEAMLEGGSATDEEVKSIIEELEVDSITTLLKNPNMPQADKYYYIVSAYSAFEELSSYGRGFYAKDGELSWAAAENYLNAAHFWQFEPVSVEDLKAMNATDTLTTCAFYIKNVGTQEYIGHLGNHTTNAKIPMTIDQSSAAPYKVSLLNSGTIVVLDNVLSVSSGQIRIHMLGHSSGAGKSGGATYWNSGLETASALRIVEAEYDMTSIDFSEVETEQAVVKGVYDLFGRRVVAPTAPGIYIIDGRKKLVK